MLFFPCANNSPIDGDSIGIPKPRKSREANVTIEPLRMNGRIANVLVSAFGRICLNIIRELLQPIAFADFTKS